MIVLNGNTTIINGHNTTMGPQPGSILFTGLDDSNLLIDNDIDFRFGTGDFTIEWWQYQTDTNDFPRVWSQGDWPFATIAVSLESGVFYLWIDGIENFFSMNPYKNIWTHFAISKIVNDVYIFQNGQLIGSTITYFDFNDTINDLALGNETNHGYGSLTAFGGYLTNFRWIKGTGLYTSNFTVPSRPLSSITNTKFLLLTMLESTAYLDSSGLNKIVNSYDTTWRRFSPF